MNRYCRLSAACAVAFLLSAPGRSAAQVVIWNEVANGDLSNEGDAPTAFTLTNGVNSIIGNVLGNADPQDWITIAVPSGFRLTAYTNSVYLSGDQQGFTGFQRGQFFVGSPFQAGSYVGYSLYGTGAQNGTYPPMNLIGVNLLPIMADPAAAPGATGFTPPLEAGDYTFLIQQLGGTTDYQFDFTVSPVPEPGSMWLLGMAAGFGIRRLTTRRRS